MSKKSKIAIIGAGWAGLAAALSLLREGYDVQVFEAASVPGGRARPLKYGPALPPTSHLAEYASDNGQHILLGAYSQTFNIMRRLGLDPKKLCLHSRLNIKSLDGAVQLRLLPLPAPLHLLGAMFTSRGLGGRHGRTHLKRVLGMASKIAYANPATLGPAASHLSVAKWLQALDCPDELLTNLWQPLCLASMNTSIEQADALTFARILHDSLGGQATDSDIYIPRQRLHDLWPARACELLGARLLRQQVKEVSKLARGWRVDGQPFDGVVLATNAAGAQALLGQLNGAEQYLASWPKFTYSAIGTLRLELERPLKSAQPMYLLRDNPATGAWGQWLFDHSLISPDPNQQNLLQVVIGRAQDYAGFTPEQIAAGVVAQLRAQAPWSLPAVKSHHLVTEKRATFDCTPGLLRPASVTPWPRLVLAGDWTATGYPAVLEGAVRSGLQAAVAIRARLR